MCWILKLFYNEIFDKLDWVFHLEKSLMIIQLLTHYTKSTLKSLINQLCDISRRAGKAGGHEPPLFPLPYHILAFFLFRQPWATTSSPSVPPHLNLPGKITFLNGIFRAFKVWFKKIQPRHAKKYNSNHFSILLKINILCIEFLNCFTMTFLRNVTEYCILKYHKV